MKSRNRQIGGGYVYTYQDGPNGVKVSYVTRQPAYIDQLVVSIDVTNGDKDDWHPQRFSVLTAQALEGVGARYTPLPPNSLTGIRYEGILTLASFYSAQAGVESSARTIVYNQALSDLYDSLRNGLDWSVDAFQAKQTAQMLKSATKLITYAKKFAYTFRRQPLRAFGDKWLEYSFGWAPLCQELYDSFNLLNKGRSLPTQVIAKGRFKYVSTTTNGATQWLPENVPVRLKHRWSHRGQFICEFSPSQTALQKLGDWTSLNPASILWELLPYSFVVDWVFDVGSYLRNMESALLYRLNFQRGIYTYTERCFTQATVNSSGTNYNWFAEGGYRWSLKDRSTLGSIPTPRFPAVHANLGAKRLLHAASLLSQHLRVRR